MVECQSGHGIRDPKSWHWRDLYLNEERFQALWRSNERIFLIASQNRFDHWRSLLQLDGRHGTPVATVGTKSDFDEPLIVTRRINRK